MPGPGGRLYRQVRKPRKYFYNPSVAWIYTQQRALKEVDIAKEETCRPVKPQYLILGKSRNSITLKETQDFCWDAFRGKIAVAEDTEKLEKMQEEHSTDDCPFLFLGYTDTEMEGEFVHLYTGDLMPAYTWADNQPNNLDGDQDCAVIDKTVDLYDMSCSFLSCPVCQVERLQVFQMSGLFEDTAVDRYYLLLEVNNQHFIILPRELFDLFDQDRKFLGYMASSLFWSEQELRWEIVDLRNDQVIAFKSGNREYPIGVHQWQFRNSSIRNLNFHRAVEEPGTFCCSDGACFDSKEDFKKTKNRFSLKNLNLIFFLKSKPLKLACDNVDHCDDGGDERKCQLVHVKEDYDRTSPPFGHVLEKEVKVPESIVIRAEITIFEILHIDDSEATFSVFFRYK